MFSSFSASGVVASASVFAAEVVVPALVVVGLAVGMGLVLWLVRLMPRGSYEDTGLSRREYRRRSARHDAFNARQTHINASMRNGRYEGERRYID